VFDAEQNPLLTDAAGINSFLSGHQLDLIGNTSLASIVLTARAAWEEIDIASNGLRAATISPTSIGRLAIADEEALVEIDMSSVEAIASIEIRRLSALRSVELDAVVTQNISIENCPNLLTDGIAWAASQETGFHHCGNADDGACPSTP